MIFAIQVSGDENLRRAFDTRHVDEWERKLQKTLKQKKRQRKRKRLLKALENIEKVEEREKLKTEYYDYEDDEYLNDSPKSIQDKLDYGSGFPSSNANLESSWPNWKQFISKMENFQQNPNVYLGSNSRMSYNPVWLRNYLLNAQLRNNDNRRRYVVQRPIRPKPQVLLGVLNTVPKPPPRYDVVYPHGIGGKL